MACSAAEWEDVANTDNWFNFAGLKCNSIVTLIDLSENIANAPANMVEGVIDTLKGMFPFNILVNVTRAWDDSAVVAQPSSISWIDDEMDNDGNITLALPTLDGLQFKATSTEIITVWGKNLGSGVTAWETWRVRIRGIITLIIGGLFIWFSIIKRGERIKEYLEELKD